MKRSLVWTTLLLSLSAGCGDDSGSNGETTAGTTGQDTDTPTTAPGTDGISPGTDGTDGTSPGTDGTTGDSTTSDGTTGSETTGVVAEEGSLQQFGGNPGAALIEGNRAYISFGPSLTVWDLDAAGGPEVIGRAAPMPGLITGVAVHQDRAYVSVNQDLWGTLEIFDISDPTAPLHLGTHPYLDAQYHNPTDVLVSSGLLFISDTENGIVSLDLTDPDQPETIDVFEVFGIEDLEDFVGRIRYRYDGFVGGTTVGTVQHVDGVMSELGSVSVGSTLDAAYASGSIYTVGAFGFEAFAMSGQSTATSVYHDETVVGRSVEATLDAAYVMSESGLRVYDVTGPTPIPGDALLVPTARSALSVLQGSTLLNLTERGWANVFDVSTPMTPVTEHQFQLPAGLDLTDAAYTETAWVLADFYTGLRLVDPETFESIGRFELVGEQVAAEGVAVAGNYAYLVDWSTGLYVIDISDPTAPFEVSFLSTGGYVSSLDIAGNYAYLGESTNGGVLRVVDISDPTHPAVVGSLTTSKIRDVEYVDGRVYLGDEEVFGTGGMRIVNVDIPENPTVLGHYQGCTHVLDLAVEGDYAYLACSGDGMHVVDISNPAQPTQVDVHAVSEHGANAIAVTDDRLFVGHPTGIVEFARNDPADPSLLFEYPIAMPARRLVHGIGRDILAAAGLAGLYQLSFE